jgi:hypothetical protein
VIVLPLGDEQHPEVILYFGQISEQMATVPLWRVYSTLWNNFAAYGDETNSNRSFMFECYARVHDPDSKLSGYQRWLRDCKLVDDAVSACFQFLGKSPNSDDDHKRVSHLLYGTAGKAAPLYEQCNMRALKKKGQFGWKYFQPTA